MYEQASFLRSILDSLEDQIAVLDVSGRIVYVNRSWIRFAADNGLPESYDWIGTDYLRVCNPTSVTSDDDACQAYDGIRTVLSGRSSSFYHEYPCHSPQELRWFLMRVTPLDTASGQYFAVSHINITQRKLVEQQVERLSMLDQLTNLANRRHFDHFLKQEWLRNMRDRSPISLVLFDLDHFKAFNDRHGHVAGDEYLRRVGQVLNAHARRPADLAARYGGEEFALILGNTDLVTAEVVAEAVRADVAGLRGGFDNLECSTSASAGVVCCIPNRGEDGEKLIQLADQALYRAKDSGRNRVIRHDCLLDPKIRQQHCRNRGCNPASQAIAAAR